MVMKRMVLLAAVAALAACATTSGGDATEHRSGFSGGRIVSIAPHGSICSLGASCAGLGATWDSTRPDRAQLVIMLMEGRYRSITGLDLNVDGRITRVEPSSLPTSLERIPGSAAVQSIRHFPVALATVRELGVAKRVWLRVHTLDGYIETAIIDGPQDSKAYHAIGRFLAQVDAGPAR